MAERVMLRTPYRPKPFSSPFMFNRSDMHAMNCFASKANHMTRTVLLSLSAPSAASIGGSFAVHEAASYCLEVSHGLK